MAIRTHFDMPPGLVDWEELADGMIRMTADFTDRQRLILALRRLMGLPVQRIADVLHVTRMTIWREERAMKKLMGPAFFVRPIPRARRDLTRSSHRS